MKTRPNSERNESLSQRTLMTKDGQMILLPVADYENAVHDQLFRYAEDLQQLIKQNEQLHENYQKLLESSHFHMSSREELNDLIDNSRDFHFVTESDGKIIQTNPAVELIALQKRILGTNIKDWVLPSHLNEFDTLLSEWKNDEHIKNKEWELHLKSEQSADEMLIVNTRLIPVKVEDEIRHLHWIMRNITSIKESEFEAQISSSVMNISNEGIMVTATDGTIIGANSAFFKITGYTAKEVIGKKSSILSSGLQGEQFYKEFWNDLREKGHWRGKIYNKRKNGEIYPEFLSVTSTLDSKGKFFTYVGVFSDLSKLTRLENDLAFLAHHDSLTGLANRLLLNDRITQAIANGRRNNLLFSIVFIDLDLFKAVNDKFGHEVGDLVLQEVARRLEITVRDVDTIARMGGDEFVIIVAGLAGDENIGRVSGKIIEALSMPMKILSHEILIGASLGCAEFPRHGSSQSELMRSADLAMYRSKKAGGNSYFIADCKSSESVNE